MDYSNRFAEYELVRMKAGTNQTTFSVRGWEATDTSAELFYFVRSGDGQTLNLPETALETTGKFETPIRLYEVIEIHPVDFETEPEVVELVGERGVVMAISVNDDLKEWSYTVVVQSGECWYFNAEELHPLNIFLSYDRLFGTGKHLPYDSGAPGTGEGIAPSESSALTNGTPTPLSLDLSSLTL